MRRAHYLTRSKSREYPRHALWFDTETSPFTIDDKTEGDTLDFGWACYRRRSRGNKWSKPYWFRFDSVESFWLEVDELVNKKECLYMFAHNMSYDLPVLKTFTVLHREGWKLESAVIDSPPVILKYRKESRTLKFIDTLNIWRMRLTKLGKHIGIPKLIMPAKNASVEEWDVYGKRDTEIIMEACIKWWAFLMDNELGGFASTLASQAMRTYRHKFMKEDLLIDSDPVALNMARDAYHGGRTECWFIGELNQSLHLVDVNSMYPSVMREEAYPTQLLGVYTDVSKTDLDDFLEEHCVVAEVTVNTTEAVYSIMQDYKLIFPVGTFDVTLTTRELQYAITNDHIKLIRHVAVYKKANIFKSYIDYMYKKRQECVKKGDTIGAKLYKLLMNSLYGKFGQRGRVYETVEQVITDEIKIYTEYDSETRTIINHRQFGGLHQAMIDEGESRDSHPAIAAHVTADARLVLWRFIKIAGVDNVYYMDTDSLLVNEKGLANLKEHRDDTKLGYLDLEKSITRATIFGSKDYWFDDKIRTKGVKSNALWLNRNVVEQTQWLGLKGLLQAGDLTAPRRKIVCKVLRREYTKGIVTESGRVEPFHLDES